MGKVEYLLKNYECKKIFNQISKDIFKPGVLETDDSKRRFYNECKIITDEYRNKVAHSTGIDYMTANKCREYVITVEMFLVNFMKWLQ